MSLSSSEKHKGCPFSSLQHSIKTSLDLQCEQQTKPNKRESSHAALCRSVHSMSGVAGGSLGGFGGCGFGGSVSGVVKAGRTHARDRAKPRRSRQTLPVMCNCPGAYLCKLRTRDRNSIALSGTCCRSTLGLSAIQGLHVTNDPNTPLGSGDGYIPAEPTGANEAKACART